MYKYKSIFIGSITSSSANFDDTDSEKLNNLFNEGWEYVDVIKQSIAIGEGHTPKFGNVLVILRKNENLTLQ